MHKQVAIESAIGILVVENRFFGHPPVIGMFYLGFHGATDTNYLAAHIGGQIRCKK